MLSHRNRYGIYSKLGERQSCPKNGDIPNSPLPTIGSLVPSVGTIPHSKNRATWLWYRQRPRRLLRALYAAHLAFIERQKAMQVPSMLRGESRTRLLQGIAVGAVASMVIGFSWGAIFASTPVAALAQPGLDPLQMMTNATNLPTAHYVDYSVVFN